MSEPTRYYADVVLVCRTCGRRSAVPVDGADWSCPCGETEYHIVPVENVAKALEQDREKWRQRDSRN